MSFDLRVHFSGLVMWVPDDENTMHVLLPSTSGHLHGPAAPSGGGGATGNGADGGVHGHEHDPHGGPVAVAVPDADGYGTAAPAANGTPAAAVHDAPAPAENRAGAAPAPNRVVTAMDAVANERHFARIVYDAAYEQPNQTQLSRRYKMVDLTDRVLDLTGIATAEGFCACLPDELASMEGVAEPVPVELVRDLPDERLAGRVTVDAGALSSYEMGAFFTFGDGDAPRRMTFETEWAVRGIASRMPAVKGGTEFLPGPVLLGPDKAQEARLPNLFPIGQTIHLTVFNTISSELPPIGARFDVKAEGRDKHFAAYYRICKPLRGGGSQPQAAIDRPPVEVEGVVPPNGPLIPSAICVQSKGKLAGSGS